MPAMIGVLYRSTNDGCEATARRGRLLVFVRVVRGRDVGTGGVPDAADPLGEACSSAPEDVLEPGAEGEPGRVSELEDVVLGRGVTGRRERLATDRKSPVCPEARTARGRRAKA
jgi:hypothetical protein